jgi:hypothetical protein
MTFARATCGSCGAIRAADDRFCRSCGRPFDDAMPAVAASVTAPSVAATPPAATPSTPFGPAGWASPPSPSRGGSRPSVGRRTGRTLLGCLAFFVVLGAIGLVGAFVSGDLDGSPRPTTPGAAIATRTPRATETPEPTTLQVTLADALSAGLVEMTAEGRDLQELSLTLTSLADEPIDVVVPAGLVFEPASGSTQSMVVLAVDTVSIEPGGSSTRTLDVACAAMHLDQPDDADSFSLSTAAAPSDLLRLLALPAFDEADFRVQQFAIWTITDDPTRDGYVALGSFGFGSGPDDEEIGQIKALFAAAGIDTDAYNALR